MRKKALHTAAAVFMAVIVMMMNVSAIFASPGVTITGGDDVKGGETFTVTVKFSGGDIGRVEGSLTYDTDRLTYISGGTSSGNSGYIQLSEAGTGEDITFRIRFQAIAGGFTNVDVTTSEVYDLNEKQMSQISGSKTINIVGSASEKDKIKESSDESDSNVQTVTERRGVDEKPADETGSTTGTTAFLVIAAAVAVLLLAVVIAALKKSRKRKKRRNCRR